MGSSLAKSALAVLVDERGTPGAELLGGALLWPFGHVARDLQIVAPYVAPRIFWLIFGLRNSG
jgi:hypothetical protein